MQCPTRAGGEEDFALNAYERPKTRYEPPPKGCTQVLCADLLASEPDDQTDQLRTLVPAFVLTAAPFVHKCVWRLLQLPYSSSSL